jgi:hypothetical protein
MPVVMLTTSGRLTRLITGAKTCIARWLDRIAEARMRKVRFEMLMYGGLHRYSSKNDDDPPIVR